MNVKYDTIVIGAGQAGLSAGYYLKRQGMRFVILEANERIGDTWRKRWDSLRLFTPARFDGLAGMPFPAPAHTFPTKDEMAEYLESYAQRFQLPVQSGVKVERLYREGERFIVAAGDKRYEAENVIVAMANYQEPKIPAYASQIEAGIRQLHSAEYLGPRQIQEGSVLIVGAGNSGSEIAMELARSHQIYMSGRAVGQLPFRIEGLAARLVLVNLVLRVLFHRVLTVHTPIGRKMRAKVMHKGGPLIRVKEVDLMAAGVQRVPKTVGVKDGLPVLEDGRRLEVANIVWCTGYKNSFSWIDLPVHGESGPEHTRGVANRVAGLYFVGLHFQTGMSSAMIHGVGRDAKHVVEHIAARSRRADQAAAVAGRRAGTVVRK